MQNFIDALTNISWGVIGAAVFNAMTGLQDRVSRLERTKANKP